MDLFSGLTYVLLIRSTIQEEILSVKATFEMWTASFGFKIHRYHAYYGIFSKQPFRSAIEDFNRTITSFGVGYNNQNATVERNVQTITLGDRTLIPLAKIY